MHFRIVKNQQAPVKSWYVLNMIEVCVGRDCLYEPYKKYIAYLLRRLYDIAVGLRVWTIMNLLLFLLLNSLFNSY